MSAELYPELPGLAFGVQRAPLWPVDVRTTPAGREYRSSSQTYPRRRIALAYEFLRTRGAWAELQALEGFYNRHRGPLHAFNLLLPEDSVASAAPFGTGNGSTTVFRLLRAWGGYTEPVLSTAPGMQVLVNGVPLSSGWTVSKGVITFTTAPASGAALAWSGTYYWRARFAQPELTFEKFLHGLWKTGKVELLTLKDFD